ncbi:hypothetical protein FPV67DRAFT_1443666 [Lyophyllum atratum]|nr:hypothetical protein FPV67DRAFT_1443666 [Lyophyllum atratum]
MSRSSSSPIASDADDNDLLSSSFTTSTNTSFHRRHKTPPKHKSASKHQAKFSALTNFLPPSLPDKALLKHAILVTTLSALPRLFYLHSLLLPSTQFQQIQSRTPRHSRLSSSLSLTFVFWPDSGHRHTPPQLRSPLPLPGPSTASAAPACGGPTTSTSSLMQDGRNSTYLADIIAHFQQEPDSTFGPLRCGQEGMQVQPTQRAEVFNGLHNALSAKGLTSSVGILADESSSLGNAGNDKQHESAVSRESYLDVGGHLDQQILIVTWEWKRLVRRLRSNGQECFNVCGHMVFQSLVLANEPHYDDGLNYYDPNYATNKNFALYIKKQFWTYKYSGNFVKPSDVPSLDRMRRSSPWPFRMPTRTTGKTAHPRDFRLVVGLPYCSSLGTRWYPTQLNTKGKKRTKVI